MHSKLAKSLVIITTWLAVILHSQIAAAKAPYFASLRATKTNVRAGPSLNYPIKFTFMMKSVPIKVIKDYQNWSEVEDYEGQTGWISKGLITKKRTVMVNISKSSINLHKKNKDNSEILLKLENSVIADYISCVKNWCAIEIQDQKGWVKRKYLFGV